MDSKAPPRSSMSPKGVPSGGGGKYVAIALLLLLGIGGVVFWKLSQKQPPPTVVTVDAGPPPSFNPRDPSNDVPPVEAEEDAGKTQTKITSTRMSSGCDSRRCSGTSGADLENALAFRVKQAHRCYDNALAQDPTLRGKVTVSVRVGANGQACSAGIAANDMSSSNVASCVTGFFRGTNFPAPKGGCVDVNIPINFVPHQ